jgi:tRNA dimethylallyltransferase
MRRLTRTFVRRQANWFKADDPDIHWFTAGEDTLDQVGSAIRTFLDEA